MSVLVTGVAGRVGSALAQRLIEDGHHVTGMVRPSGRAVPASLAPEIDVVEASLADPEALARAVRGVDVVVHLAAQMVIGQTPVDTFFDANVMGMLRLLEAAVGQDRPVRRFVFGSTDNTYGPAVPRATLITEDHVQLPGGLLRNVEGLGRAAGAELPRAARAGVRYPPLRIGARPARTPPLFRLDWVRAFLGGQALNIVGPRTTTFAEAAGAIAARSGVDPVPVQMPMKLAFELSTAKAHRLVGYTPAWDFAGVLDTALEHVG